MNKALNVLKALWAFASDWKYRHYFIEKYWRWKAKTVCFILVILVVFSQVVKIDYFGTRWNTFKGCVGEEWDTGRDTKFGFMFNSCVIDSGKRDSNDEIVWQKVGRDFNVGDGQ